MTDAPFRRNPTSRRPGRAHKAPRSRARRPLGLPPREVIARWRAELLADTAFLGWSRPTVAARMSRYHAWWAGLDLATATEEEVAMVWRWRADDAVEPAPCGWEVILAMHDGDREAARAALSDELALRDTLGAGRAETARARD